MSKKTSARNGADDFTGKYDFLSNSYLSSLVYNGTLYKSVTHAFNAEKVASKIDKKTLIETLNPSDVTRLSRKMQTKDNWWEGSKKVMEEILRQKFSNPFLSSRLIDTGDVELGTSKSYTGELLMKIRTELRGKMGDNDIKWS